MPQSWSSWFTASSWPWYDWLVGLSRSITFFTSAIWIYIKSRVGFPHFRNASREQEEAAESELRRKCAKALLDLVLRLKGYYIKAAQTLCGAGVFPKEFDDAFAVLLDQCPREPFHVVRDIVEEELGCSLDDVFEEFAEEAVAAASIGQVHFAVLKDGTPVAVKVQYPSVERYFRMDVRTVSFLLWLQGMGDQVHDIFEVVEAQLENEFDYTREAALMRECAELVLPHYCKKVAVPLPLDAAHPSCLAGGVPTLCTRKVLTMERLDGAPIRTHTLQMLELFAKANGTTVEELQKQMRTTDPSKVDMNNKAVRRAMRMGAMSECASLALIAGVRVHNFACRVASMCGGGGCLPKIAQPEQKQVAVPLNGVRIARLLFDVHGFEIFQAGLFNSDPHAGNVLMLKDGRLGLLDYGAVARLTREQRTDLARLVVAIADEDDDAVPEHFFACGFRSKNSDPRLALLMAHISFNRGPFPYDMNRIAPKIGMPLDADLNTLDEFIRGGELDEIEDMPGHLIMFQRCCMVLSGIGMELGAGRLSSAGMLRPRAEEWLRQQDGKDRG